MARPDKWVVVKVEDGYKVFGSYAGGYVEGDSWRLNSGIVEVRDEGDYYDFYGHSGSIYSCMKGYYGVAGAYNNGVLEKLREVGGVVLDGDVNWMELLND